jgi:hypothetical protein
MYAPQQGGFGGGGMQRDAAGADAAPDGTTPHITPSPGHPQCARAGPPLTIPASLKPHPPRLHKTHSPIRYPSDSSPLSRLLSTAAEQMQEAARLVSNLQSESDGVDLVTLLREAPREAYSFQQLGVSKSFHIRAARRLFSLQHLEPARLCGDLVPNLSRTPTRLDPAREELNTDGKTRTCGGARRGRRSSSSPRSLPGPKNTIIKYTFFGWAIPRICSRCFAWQ